MTTYKAIPFGPWAIAVALVAAPVFVLTGRWVWAYVGLILTYYVIFNLDELGALIDFAQSYLPKE